MTLEEEILQAQQELYDAEQARKAIADVMVKKLQQGEGEHTSDLEQHHVHTQRIVAQLNKLHALYEEFLK